MMVALTRPVPSSISRCELTHLDRVPIDLDRAVAQHAAYEAALESAGCTIVRLPAEPDLPDSVFVEDTAVVLDDIAVVTRPGVETRRAEAASVTPLLGKYRQLRCVEAPATMDGGDVLCVGRRIFVGLSTRTNMAAVEQLRGFAAASGYSIMPVEAHGCLHLKSAATALSDDVILLNPAWIDRGVFGPLATVDIDPREPFAANVLRIGATVICAGAAPRTRDRLAARGCQTVSVDMSELAKAEGALTCCSVIIE
jgi:dimethylargininase